MERYALQQSAEGNAEDQRRHHAADEEAPVPGIAPAGIVNLGPVVEADGTEEQREQHQQHRHVEAGKGGGIDHRPGGEDGAARGDEPDLIAVPVRADGVDGDAAFGVGTGDEGQEAAHPHVHAVGDGKPHEECSDEDPPDELQGFIIEHCHLP